MLKPKRKDVVLVDGRMVLSSDGGDPPSRRGPAGQEPVVLDQPRQHHPALREDRWRSRSRRDRNRCEDQVRGQSRLEVVYEYESINGRPVSLAARRMLASTLGSSTR